MKKKIILTIFLVSIFIIGIFLVFYFWPIKIDSNTVSNLNGGLGKGGQDMGYNWNVLPDRVQIGYLISIKNTSNKKKFESSCIMGQSNTDDFSNRYYCQASWPSDFFSPNNLSGDMTKNEYNIDKYSFTARPTFNILWQDIKDFFIKPDPVPALIIETGYFLPDATQGEPYNARIDILYTGKSPLMADFSALPQGILVESGIVNGKIEIKNQMGKIIISGTPTEVIEKGTAGNGHGILLTLSSENGVSKEVKQFNLMIGPPVSALKLIPPSSSLNGAIGQDYTVKFRASGGKPPYSWSYSDIWKNNDFCSSLIMKPDGILTSEGTGIKPTKGSCALTIDVEDSTGESMSMLYGFEIK